MTVLDAVVVIAGALVFIPRIGTGIHLLIASLLLFAYAGVGFFWPQGLDERLLHRLKVVLLLGIIASTIGYRTYDMIDKRHLTKPPHIHHVHDHPLQMEASVAFLLNGQNPYSADFRKTEMAYWMGGNPALNHVIALPVTFLKSVPFSVAWHKLYGWYDDRISHIFLFVLMIAALYALPRNPTLKLLAVAVAVFNPLFAPFFTEGRSDIVFLSFLLTSLALLRRGWQEAALLFMALALGSKHTAFFIMPFLLVYLWRKGAFTEKQQHIFILPLMLMAVVFVPFMLWDFHAFVADVYRYPAGTINTSYPINGFGLSRILVTLKIIANRSADFPVGLFSIPLIPLLAVLIKRVWRTPTIGNMLMSYAMFLWPFWFLSRFFHDNYMGVVITIIALAVVMLYDERVYHRPPAASRWKFWRKWEKT